MRELVDIIEDSGFEVRSYSGRGMYGKECLGISLNRYQNIGELIACMLESVSDLEEVQALANAFHDMNTDSLGLGQIVYFPSIPYASDPDDHEDPPDSNYDDD